MTHGIIDDKPALVSPGKYELKFMEYRTGTLFGRTPKLMLSFVIISPGEHFGANLNRYYNIKRPNGKQGKNGRFTVGWGSDFAKEFAKLFPSPQRPDRFPMSSFNNVAIFGNVETVIKDHKQHPLPKQLHYSVIRNLISISSGGCSYT